MRVGLYLRVSTADQTEENQLPDLVRLAQRRGWEPMEYRERASAATPKPVLDHLMADARAGRVGAVVIWALHCLDLSMLRCIQIVLELDGLGVPVISLREPWLHSSGPVRPLLMALFGSTPELERTRLVRRIKARQAHARRHGKDLARPRVSQILLIVGAGRVDRGEAVRAVARTLGFSERTLRRFMASGRAAAHAVP